MLLKLIYSEKATKFCEISTSLWSYVVPVKSKVEISQSFVAFSEYINFITYLDSILNDLSTTYVPDTTNVNKEEKEKQKV